jgi:hypothetical protein
MNDLYKRISKVLIFVISLQLFSLFITQEFLISKVVEIPSYEPFGNATVTQASLNAASLIFSVIIMTIVFIVMIKIFGKMIIRNLFLIFSIIIVWIVNPIYVFAIQENYFPNIIFPLDSITNIILIAVLIYATIKFDRKLLIISAFIVFAEVGSFLAQTFVPPTLFLVLFAFVIYDMFAVFYGPLKYLVKELGFPSKPTKKQIKKMTMMRRELNLGIFAINIGDMVIGSGDFIFYSLAASSALILGGLFASAMTIVAICVGFFINAVILSKFRRAIPGLPIPILLALAILIMI